MSERLNLLKQLLIFIAVSLAGTLLFGLASNIFKTSLVGASVLIPMVAALISGRNFVQTYNRAPDKEEARRLTLSSFLSYLGLQGLYAVWVYWSPEWKSVIDNIDSEVIGLLALFAFLFLIISFFLIRWAYGGLTEKFAEQRQ